MRVLLALGLLSAAYLASATTVIESGLRADDSWSVYWVSADEVLFVGVADEYVTREDGFRERVRRVTKWNVKTNAVKRYERVTHALCYDKGNISYLQINVATNQYWSSYGRFEGDITREERHRRFDRFTCLPEEHMPALPDWTRDRWIVRLRPEHGFLDLGPSREMKNTPVRLFHFGSDVAVDLPIKRREFVEVKTKFYPFKGAYFFESNYFEASATHPWGGINRTPWPAGVARPVWWLFPDGRVEEVVIPAAVWMRDGIVPTRRALVTTSNAFMSVTGEARDGVYVLDGKGGAERVLRGITDAATPSDDGCKVALRRQPKPGTTQPPYWTITVLQLCEGE